MLNNILNWFNAVRYGTNGAQGGNWGWKGDGGGCLLVGRGVEQGWS